MDRIDAMRVFARVLERGSFVRAAEDLGLPASTATDAVKQLEARLGVRLLQRTTRQVSPTLDGEAYYRRCLAILDDIEEAESAFSGARPRGLLRIDVQGAQARRVIVPALPRFFAEYPDLALFMGEGDRFVDLVREGVDCVLRAGELRESDLIQVPRYSVEAEIANGALVECLADTPPSPTPVTVLYPRSRQLSLRVRIFIDWVAKEYARWAPPERTAATRALARHSRL